MDTQDKKQSNQQAGFKGPRNYWNYLKIEQLLSLQDGFVGDESQMLEDEMHFIIVHQVFELWFKQVIRELYLARDRMIVPKVDERVIPFVAHHLKRVNTIMDSAIKQFDVMETLIPQDFLVFRDGLGTASGFQSFQMREMELILGLEQSERNAYGHEDPVKFLLESAEKVPGSEYIIQRIQNAQAGPSLRDAIHTWLYRTPIHGSSPDSPGDGPVTLEFIATYIDAMKQHNEELIKVMVRDGGDEEVIRRRFDTTNLQVESFLYAHDVDESQREQIVRIRAGVLFIESYRDLPLLSWPRLLLDSVAQLEESFVRFRSRHARMVERVIGRRVGSGGSSGVDYLDETVRYRIFKELWQVRTLLLPRHLLPPLENSDVYGFSVEGEDTEGDR
ncbi:MAG: tryptophan 2,3-dioxygenase [bacterium]|nr:tryptophan 2,3-dioxygenase [bacterium]